MMDSSESSPRRFFNTRTITLMLGLAAFWAYFDSCFFSFNIMKNLSQGIDAMPEIRCIGFLTAGLVSFLAAKFPKFMETRFCTSRAFRALSVAASLLAALISIPFISSTPALYLLTFGACGICGSLMMLIWVKYFSLEDRTKDRVSAGLLVAGSLALSGGLVLPVSMFHYQFSPLAVASFPLLGVACQHLYQTMRNLTSGTETTNHSAFKPWAPFATDSFVEQFGITRRLLVAAVAFSFVTAMAQPLLNASGVQENNLITTVYESSRYGTALVVLLGALLITIKPYIVFRAGMLFVIGAYMLMPLLPENWRFFSVAITNGGYTCLELMVWMVMFESARLRNASAMRVIGVGRLAIMTSACAGFVVANLFGESMFSPEHISAFMTLTAYVLLVALVIVLDESKSASSWYLLESSLATPYDGDRLTARCNTIAAEKDLTPRELDVLLLLAAGRSASYIAQELYIAQSTVNYHIRHIYEKCGVRSKQELIDAVQKNNF
ncbi:MAG TPA: helix-turn-helix transcriptional regulator [Slackia equolifaciens]|uniref:Helix-turn-helix transcriptional regulator n=1 Tax=Slackia equolifaciens TaxID=498718 RepID=A0A9D3A2E5_9ACTN|nr:helix-turn-helix transcriptional regulator [Slackia equolifaciens]